jgi:hypothetical protein
VSTAPARRSYTYDSGLPAGPQHHGFNGPIIVTFDAPVDPASVILEVKYTGNVASSSTPRPAQSTYNPASTFRVLLRGWGGGASDPTHGTTINLVISGNTIEIHNKIYGSIPNPPGPNVYGGPVLFTDTWETNQFYSYQDVTLYLTGGLKNTSGTPITLTAPQAAGTSFAGFSFTDVGD